MSALALLVLLAQAGPAITVLLDPGHGPENPGARSASGRDEVEYNDRLAAALSAALAPGDLRVLLTREPGVELGLDERFARAERERPALVLSLHHDSVQPGFLEPAGVGRTGPTCPRFRGFSLFVAWRGARPQISLRLARRISVALCADGRVPSEHHAMPIHGEGRPWLERQAGIHEGSYIRLVRKLAEADIPAVLLEAGVLVHPDEERELSDPTRVEAMAAALAGALLEHLRAEAALESFLALPAAAPLAPWLGYPRR